MKTLIQIQEQAITKLDVTRSSAKRYAKLRGVVYRWYLAQVAKFGITGAPANATWKDVRDMSELRRDADAA